MKKIIIFLLVIFTMSLSAIFFQSCEDDEKNITNADLLVSSSEFQALTAEIQKNRNEIRKNYLKLSKEQRQEFRKINSEISKGEASSEELDVLTKKLSSIIKIDYKKRIENIANLASKAYKDQKISTKDFLIAMEKNKIKNENLTVRIKTRSESDDPQLDYELCCLECDSELEADFYVCRYLHEGDYEGYNNCCLIAGAKANNCNADCMTHLEPR